MEQMSAGLVGFSTGDWWRATMFERRREIKGANAAGPHPYRFFEFNIPRIPRI